MGTRCLTVVEDENGNEILNMMRQMDGYPEGHGAELAEFLKDMVIVNGVSMNDTRKIANGMGCLAAQLVAHFKDYVGEFYLMPPKHRGFDEEYVYTVKLCNGKLVTSVFDVYSGHYIGDEMEMKEVESSNISKVGFDSVKGELVVEFHNGSVYSYQNVPIYVYHLLIEAPSIGSYFNKNIKDSFEFTKQ